MSAKYSEYTEHTNLMEGRFENGFPMLYPMDRVKVSPRWSGGGKNMFEGREGYVHQIRHGMQSAFNRDYLIVGLMGRNRSAGEFQSWLYTLDLVGKDETTGIASSVKKQFGCLVYIDDRIEVISHPRLKGRTGGIISMQGTGSEGGGLGLKVRDEIISEEMGKLYGALNGKIEEEFERRNTPGGFGDFVANLRSRDAALCRLLEQKELVREAYEMQLRESIFKEQATKQEFEEAKRILQEQSIFFVSSRDVKLVERFPPNDLFKI